MSLRPEIRRINKWLLDTFGWVPDTNQPKFRVVWGPSIIVTRMTYYPDGSEKGYRDRPKYQYIAPNAWVLESYFTALDPNTLNTDKGCYEPLHAFYDSSNQPVDPILDKVQEFMNALYEGIERAKYENKSDVDRANEEAYTKDWKRIYDYLNSDSFLHHNLHQKQATSVNGLRDEV